MPTTRDLKPHQRRLLTIDEVRLDKIAGNPAIKSKQIPELFGVGFSSFFNFLSRNPRLWDIYATARARAGFQVSSRTEGGRAHRRILQDAEIKILEAVASLPAEARTLGAIRLAAIARGVEPGRFAFLFYNLENEQHEIWSVTDGKPPVTRYRLRGEEVRAETADDAEKARAA